MCMVSWIPMLRRFSYCDLKENQTKFSYILYVISCIEAPQTQWHSTDSAVSFDFNLKFSVRKNLTHPSYTVIYRFISTGLSWPNGFPKNINQWSYLGRWKKIFIWKPYIDSWMIHATIEESFILLIYDLIILLEVRCNVRLICFESFYSKVKLYKYTQRFAL